MTEQHDLTAEQAAYSAGPPVEWKHSTSAPEMLDADYWSEVVDPDDPDYLAGTAMSRD